MPAAVIEVVSLLKWMVCILFVNGGVGTKPPDYLQNHNCDEATIIGKPDLSAQNITNKIFYIPGFLCICFKVGISFLINNNRAVVIVKSIAIEPMPTSGLTC